MLQKYFDILSGLGAIHKCVRWTDRQTLSQQRLTSWLRSTVIERRHVAGELSLSYA